MKIRKYKEKDKEQIFKLVKGVLIEIFTTDPTPWIKDLEDIKKNFVIFLVAESKNKIIGTIGLVKEKDNYKIKRLYVKKIERRKGIAQKLYNGLEKFCKKKGIKKIVLTTYPQMKEAAYFYDKNGFKIRKKHYKFYRFKIYKVLEMEKKLR